MSKKNIIIGLCIGLVLVIVTVIIKLTLFNKQTEIPPKQSSVFEEDKLVPTLDASTEVNLKSVQGGREALLSIQNIPNGTSAIDYVVSYETESQGFQGVQGSIPLDKKESDYEKQFTLGTCSSGRCVYHTIVGMVKLELKFSGDYGEKIYEKEIEL